MTKLIVPALAAALLLPALLPASPALAGHVFTNKTSAGLRCRLANDTRDTAMSIQLEPMESVSVMGTYRDIRCMEPVLRQRFALADGGRYVFTRNKDGNTIGLAAE